MTTMNLSHELTPASFNNIRKLAAIRNSLLYDQLTSILAEPVHDSTGVDQQPSADFFKFLHAATESRTWF